MCIYRLGNEPKSDHYCSDSTELMYEQSGRNAHMNPTPAIGPIRYPPRGDQISVGTNGSRLSCFSARADGAWIFRRFRCGVAVTTQDRRAWPHAEMPTAIQKYDHPVSAYNVEPLSTVDRFSTFEFNRDHERTRRSGDYVLDHQDHTGNTERCCGLPRRSVRNDLRSNRDSL